MIRIRRYTIIRLFYISIDILCMMWVVYAACWLRPETLPFPVTFENVFFNMHVNNPYRLIFFFWIVITVLVNHSHGLYQTLREIYETMEIWQILRSVIVSSLLTIFMIFLTRPSELFPRSIFIIIVCSMILSFTIWRICKRILVERLVAGGYNNFNALIIGAGKVGMALAQEIEKRPGLGIKIIGFLENREDLQPDKYKIVGKISDFATLAQREFINKVFITIHHDSQMFLEILEQARDMGIAVRVIPHGFELMTGECLKYNIGYIPILEYCDVEHPSRQAGKRLFDFLIAALTLLLLFPAFLVIFIWIKWDSSGPVIYRSRRYGRQGKIFPMYKFRSMVHRADELMPQLREKNEVDGPIFKMKNDPRVTRVGRYLRKYSLDELPQLFNVLRGEMSLVGPRPFPIEQVEREDLKQLKRLEVRPGITGLWQIRGRSDISFSKLVKWDIWYINNWSFWLDLSILLQTVPVVIKGKGAY